MLVELNERSLPVALLGPAPGSGPECLTRKVETIGEIWRVDDEWWRAPICRRYIEVILQGGKHTVLYQDLTNDEWFEQTP